jgi:hypothetical protein
VSHTIPASDGWFKSSHSGSANGSCVEARRRPDAMDVRDTKDRNGGTLTFTRVAWASWVRHVRENALP